MTVSRGSTGVVVDANNSTTAVLAAGATFTGAATDISAYAQVNVELFGRPGVVAGDASSAKASLFIEFSPDGTNWDISIPSLVRDPSLVIPTPLINAGRFFRVRYLNDGGVAAIAAFGLPDVAGTPTLQTAFRLTTQLLPRATKELTRTMDQGIGGSDPAGLVISTGLGKNPAGAYTKEKADGNVATSTAVLAASGIYTSAWFDSDGWRSIELFVATDQASATDGIDIQFTGDVTAGTPVVRGSLKRSFTTADIARGFIIIRTAVTLDGFRVKYINGGALQGSMFLQINVRVDNVELPSTNYGSDTTSTNLAIMTRGSLIARNDSDIYDTIYRATNGGLRIAVHEHDVETPLKSLVTPRVTRTAITTTAAKVVATPQANRRSISIKAICATGTLVYIGFDSGVTAANGYPMTDNDTLDIELDATADIWAIASTGTQGVAVIEVST